MRHRLARSAGGARSCGDCSSTSACPRPCGESTTRKKLAKVTNGPSGGSLSQMPGFSPDHSTVPAKTIGSAIVLSSSSWPALCPAPSLTHVHRIEDVDGRDTPRDERPRGRDQWAGSRSRFFSVHVGDDRRLPCARVRGLAWRLRASLRRYSPQIHPEKGAAPAPRTV